MDEKVKTRVKQKNNLPEITLSYNLCLVFVSHWSAQEEIDTRSRIADFKQIGIEFGSEPVIMWTVKQNVMFRAIE